MMTTNQILYILVAFSIGISIVFVWFLSHPVKREASIKTDLFSITEFYTKPSPIAIKHSPVMDSELIWKASLFSEDRIFNPKTQSEPDAKNNQDDNDRFESQDNLILNGIMEFNHVRYAVIKSNGHPFCVTQGESVQNYMINEIGFESVRMSHSDGEIGREIILNLN